MVATTKRRGRSVLTGPRLGATLPQSEEGGCINLGRAPRAPEARWERVSGADESSLSEVPMSGSRAGEAREARATEVAGRDSEVRPWRAS